jgi:uncharacterized protein YjbI with pentapeptide repeats
MHRDIAPKADRVVLCFGCILVCVLIIGFPNIARGQDGTRQQLEERKLRAEIRKLELDIAKADSRQEDILSWAPLVTVLVAVGAVVLPVLSETRRQRKHREDELEQRTVEAQRSFDERYAQALENLASESEPAQVAGASTLGSLLRPEYQGFHEDIYQVLYANLSLEHSDLVNRVLVPVFSAAVRLHLAAAAERGAKPELLFTRMWLPRVDLSGLDLNEIDLAFSDFRDANLSECKLVRARGLEVNLERARLSRSDLSEARFLRARCRNAHFHQARLVSAELTSADLAGAEFFMAQLQGAHFDEADLRGARFDEAVLSDTYFVGAQLDSVALRSITKARSWENAHFDPQARAALADMLS